MHMKDTVLVEGRNFLLWPASWTSLSPDRRYGPNLSPWYRYMDDRPNRVLDLYIDWFHRYNGCYYDYTTTTTTTSTTTTSLTTMRGDETFACNSFSCDVLSYLHSFCRRCKLNYTPQRARVEGMIGVSFRFECRFLRSPSTSPMVEREWRCQQSKDRQRCHLQDQWRLETSRKILVNARVLVDACCP